MPISLGYWAVAGAGGGVATGPAMDLISTATGNGSATTITFSSIPQTYKHLQIRAVTKTQDGGNSYTGRRIYLNGSSSGTEYSSQYFGNSAQNQAFTGASQSASTMWIGNSNGSSNVGPMVFDIFDYTSTSKNVTVRGWNCTTNAGWPWQENTVFVGVRNTLAAVTSITIQSAASGFSTTSRFALYGIRG